MRERFQAWMPYVGLNWSSFGEYLALMERKGSAVNLGFLVGHGTIRIAVMGYETRAASKNELEIMKNLLAKSMEEGAFGMSTGLVYHPGTYADTNELIELCRIVAKYGGVYSTHKRGQGDEFIEATKEAIEIGEESGVRVQISHHAPNMTKWGKNQETIEMIETAQKRGVEVLADKHGYTYGSGNLLTVFPPWFRMQTIEKQIQGLRDPEIRARIKKEAAGGLDWPRVTPALLARAGKWSGLVIMGGKNKDFIGKNVEEISKSTRKDPYDVIFDLMIENNMSVRTVNTNYDEEDLRNGYRSWIMMISADASAFSPSGPLKEITEIGQHAKLYGTFPQIFRKYVRGENRKDLPWESEGAKILTLEEAVRKMTSLPAQMLRLMDRGMIRPGMAADIVIFDPEKIADRSTYADPYVYPAGISYVIVNGKIAVEQGEYSGVPTGKILRFRRD